ncbi:MAG: histidine--tRNA ligase [Cyclobacteriaceae bacterium]
MATSKPSIPKGTRDFGPEESSRRNYIIDKIKSNFLKYGFNQIETPSMEQLSTLMGKYGDEGDQLVFKIVNSGDYLSNTTEEDYSNGSKQLLPKISEKGLRYDLTVPFARYVVQHRNDITFPFKRFQIQPVWRADRPQKGRYREFYQCDADIIGTDSIWNEVNLTFLIHDVFNDLKYSNFTLKVNHRSVLDGLATYVGLEGKTIPFCVAIDKLDKIGEEKVRTELSELGAKTTELDDLFSLFAQDHKSEEKITTLLEKLPENKGLNELQEYFRLLSKGENYKLNIELDFSLARGLTYYTGMIFEVKSNDVKIGSISGGGRYDNLTGVFGLDGVSGVGISFGLDRIYDVLLDRGLFPEESDRGVEIAILHFDSESFDHGIDLLMKLRDAEISCEIYPDLVKIKKQFAFADKIKSKFSLVIGSDEIKSQKYSLKNMSSGEQQTLSLEEIIKIVRSN